MDLLVESIVGDASKLQLHRRKLRHRSISDFRAISLQRDGWQGLQERASCCDDLLFTAPLRIVFGRA